MTNAPINRRRVFKAGGALLGAVMLFQHRLTAKVAATEQAQEEQPMESVTSADGTHIAYQRFGDGPPLVLVHGSLDDHHRWTPLQPLLGERFTVYAIDRRGRGGSMAADGAPYAIEREFEDVAAVVDAIDEPAHLLGHSYGAICAAEAALLTENLRKLVLYEPPIFAWVGGPSSPPGEMADVQAKIETLLAAGDREGAVLVFAQEIAQVPEEVIAMFRAAPEWQGVLDIAPTIVDEMRGVKGYVFDPARFRDLTTPALLLMGSESPPFLQAATEAVAAALPHGRLVVLPGQGHLAMDFAPDLFLREITQFLTEA
ncbi:MAG: alpha/beta fold hydrolase [Thermomicrobiales bacterium]